MLDEITDDELLEFMREQFENVCYGDFDYLEGTCLDLFAQAIRAGYSGYKKAEGRGEFENNFILKTFHYFHFCSPPITISLFFAPIVSQNLELENST